MDFLVNFLNYLEKFEDTQKDYFGGISHILKFTEAEVDTCTPITCPIKLDKKRPYSYLTVPSSDLE